MNPCCNTANPLRRDGTSQNQRFPLALAESYVKIDERRAADILEFLRKLAAEFRYYDLTNVNNGPGDDWVEFLAHDVSFILSSHMLFPMGQYREAFYSRWEPIRTDAMAWEEDNYPASGGDAIKESIAQLFLTFIKTNTLISGYLHLPAMLSTWIKDLPEASMFADGSSYAFRDLVLDARERLSPLLQRLWQMDVDFVASFNPPTNDLSGWGDLQTNYGWSNLVPPLAPTGPVYTNEDISNILTQLKSGMDSLLGIMEGLQMALPGYLEQSFAHFPHHAPQNALLLAFLQLFRHAQDHLNSLTRRHLLYHYKDVLRFMERPLTPDQAAVIIELRKGTATHILTAGTLLKAGKDALGKDRFFQVLQETAVNQGKLALLQSVHVERATVTKSTYTTGSNTPTIQTSTQLKGVYGSPIANSADGLGAPLDKQVPKWSMFGEAQSMYADLARTMPDARLGMAVSTPMFYMREGKREVMIGFLIPQNGLGLGDGSANAIARIEATLYSGLVAEYTQEKAWGTMRISGVRLIPSLSASELGLRSEIAYAFPELGTASSLPNKPLLLFRLALDEADKAMVAYNEKFHQASMSTQWPMIRVGVGQNGFDYRDDRFDHEERRPTLGLVAWTPTPATPINQLRLYEGRVYRSIESVPANGAAPPFNPKYALVENFDQLLNLRFPLWSADREYPSYPGSPLTFNVYHKGDIYTVNLASGASSTNLEPGVDPVWIKWSYKACPYAILEDVKLEKVLMQARASGIAGFELENDAGRIKSTKPFQPFGPIPVKGSKLLIGSTEIFGKKLEELTLDITWQDPPGNFRTYYSHYAGLIPNTERLFVPYGEAEVDRVDVGMVSEGRDGFTVFGGMEDIREVVGPPRSADLAFAGGTYHVDNSIWKAKFQLLGQGRWTTIVPDRSLFNTPATNKQTIVFTKPELASSYQTRDLTEPGQFDTKDSVGFLKMELSNPSMAFGHAAYRDLYVKEAIKVAFQTAHPDPEGTEPTPDFPNEPYTPVIKELRIGYITRGSIDLTKAANTPMAYSRRLHQYFHLHPFGYTEEHAYLLNGTEAQILPSYDEEGQLYLGFSDLVPATTLSVLFQFVEDSGDPDFESGAVTWSVLSNNKWQSLKARDILIDTTDELITSGIIRFNLPEAMSAGNTMLHGGYRWLRASTPNNTRAFLKVLGIIPQAVLTAFHNMDNDTSHLAKALSSGTITALAVNDPVVKGVSQPYASQDGKLPEQADRFLTRVSERLRHRQRAVSVWDYEHLVLEQFPSIFKVKCINHTEYLSTVTGKTDWEISPGYVTVVCIPDLRNRNAVNPFEPKTSVRLLKQVTNFLQQHATAWASIKAANPLYEQVQVSCEIEFVPGKDPGYYTAELETELQRFLSPWAFDNTQEITFGTQIHRSHLIHFVEQRPYVDHVLKFKLSQMIDGVMEEVEAAKASRARSILVSALTHDIRTAAPCPTCCPDCAQDTKKGQCSCHSEPAINRTGTPPSTNS